MRRHYRNIALAISLGVATVALAQVNPTQRGGADRDPFGSGSMHAAPRSEDLGRNSFGQHGMTRPEPRKGRGHSVSPVPEPGQWAMMLAGLALVGWIVRRNSKR
jgi:hypothetical protein